MVYMVYGVWYMVYGIWYMVLWGAPRGSPRRFPSTTPDKPFGGPPGALLGVFPRPPPRQIVRGAPRGSPRRFPCLRMHRIRRSIARPYRRGAQPHAATAERQGAEISAPRLRLQLVVSFQSWSTAVRLSSPRGLLTAKVVAGSYHGTPLRTLP